MRNDWWRNHFGDTTNGENIESNRKMLGVISFCILGGSTCLLFGIFTPSQENLILRGGLIFCALFLYINALSLKFHKRYDLAFDICGYGIIPPALIIVASGGYQDTGLYWVYPFLISSFMFLGHLKGLIANIVTLIAIYLICSNPELIEANYRDIEVNRFLSSFIVSILLCFAAEYFRFRSFNRLADISSDQHKLANTDALTSLANRRFIDAEFLPATKSSPESYFPLVAVLIDLDHFKQVNDTYGHHIGDKVLKHVAENFRACTRDTDIISRIGGEEFLLLIPKAELSTGIGIAEKIRERIERNPFTTNEDKVYLSISGGVAVAESPTEIDSSINTADKLMYQAKNNGRNRIEYQINKKLN